MTGYIRTIMIAVMLHTIAHAALDAQDSIPIVLSASGGISAGSYQGGASYAIIEFLRRQRNPAYRDRFVVSGQQHYLASAAGASAGNINALLGALSWCARDAQFGNQRSDTIPAEESLYWQTWVNLGIGQLLPANPAKKRSGTDPAVFDRRFTRVVSLPALKAFTAGATPVSNCNLPVGLTLTKLIPYDYEVAKGLSAKAQRMATVFSVRAAGARIVFDTVTDKVRKRGSLGTLVLLPELYNRASSDSTRWAAIFNAVTASSAFPVAFGTQEVCFVPADTSKTRQKGTECEQFLDGGAFDNNPFALGVGMLDKRGLVGPQNTVLLTYSNPGQTRAPFIEPLPHKSPVESGLAGLLQLAAGFYPSARQYELQLLGRQLQRDSEFVADHGNPALRPPDLHIAFTTRSAPIYGDRIGAFAGFLGRPWREYDFYAGVYDGLRYVAERFLCPPNEEQCVAERHRVLIEHNALGVSPVAKAMLRTHAAFEYAPNSYIPTSPPKVTESDAVKNAATEAERDRALLVAASFDAISQLRPGHHLRGCNIRGTLGRTFCNDSLGAVILTLRDDKRVRRAAARRAEVCNALAEDERYRCPADQEFSDLLKNPTSYLEKVTDRVMSRLELAEDNILYSSKDRPKGTIPPKSYSPWVELGYLAVRSSNYDARHGLKFNPSSARLDWTTWKAGLASIVGIVAPHYVALAWSRDSSGANREVEGDRRPKHTTLIGGWVPTYFLSERGRVVAPIEASLHTFGEHGEIAIGQVRGGLGFRFGEWMPVLHGFQLSALVPCEIGTRRPNHCSLPTYEISNELVFHKLRFAFGVNPRLHSTHLSAGIADVNGMLYWILR
jgi:hypothetical protein